VQIPNEIFIYKVVILFQRALRLKWEPLNGITDNFINQLIM
jgi:hypothetical protein